jgi:hypothetical protein
MPARLAAIALALPLLLGATAASAQDIELCFDVADRVAGGLGGRQRAAHEACQRALAATASIVQKLR